jgi:cytochrome c-type biogenesis protein CcmE
MPETRRTHIRIGAAIAIIVLSLGYLAYTGVQESKSYYVTIAELRKDAAEGDKVYAKRLRVAGNVVPGSIKRQGSRVEFSLQEKDDVLPIVYHGTEAPPDTFKDNAQALAEGSLGRDGVFQAKTLQAKCASKYAPQQQTGSATTASGASAPAKPSY